MKMKTKNSERTLILTLYLIAYEITLFLNGIVLSSTPQKFFMQSNLLPDYQVW